MNKHRRLSQLYEAGLRIYPKDLREAYGEQMLITAQDALLDTHSRIELAIVVGKLTVDLFFTAIKENIKQAGVSMKKHTKTISKKSKGAKLLFGLQIAGVALLSFLWLSYALSTFNAMFNIGSQSLLGGYFWKWSTAFIEAMTPLMILPLAFAIVHKTTDLSGWQKIVRSYSLGFLGVLCYLLMLYFMEVLSVFYTVRSSNYEWTRPGFEWAVGLLFLAGFYLLGLRLKKPFGKPVHG